MSEEELDKLLFKFQQMRKFYFPNLMDFMKKAKYVTSVSFHGMTVTLCKLLNYYLTHHKVDIIIGDDKDKEVDLVKVEHLFCLSTIWAFGGVLILKDTDDWRRKFSDYWKSNFNAVKFPSKGTIYDYFVKLDESRPSFDEWKNLPVNISFPDKFNMKEITIPIPETQSVAELTRNLLRMSHPILLVGNSGSGKTQLINGILKDIKSIKTEEYFSTSINFNYYTDSTYLQTMLEQELVKQGNRYGPRKGGKAKLIYFIDDLNMPQLDEYDT